MADTRRCSQPKSVQRGARGGHVLSEQARKAGRKAGRQAGREEGRKAGRKKCRTSGRKEREGGRGRGGRQGVWSRVHGARVEGPAI